VTGVTGPGGGGGGAATDITAIDTLPAFGFADVQEGLDKIKGVLNPGVTGAGGVLTGYSMQTFTRRHYIVGVSGKESTSATGFTTLGAMQLDTEDYRPSVPSGGSQHVQFAATFRSSAGLTGTVQLYDVGVGTAVDGSILATTTSTPTYMATSDLSISTGPQNLEVQGKLGSSATGPTGADAVLVNMARIEIYHD
jgi:hypothetical protein